MAEVALDQDDDTRMTVRASDRETYLVQLVPGSRWDPGRRLFTVPRSWAVWLALQGIFGSELSVEYGVEAWFSHEYSDRVQACQYLRGQLTVHPALAGPSVDALNRWESRAGGTLYPHQRVGALFLAKAGAALLADEVGTGKTVTTIAAFGVLDELGLNPFPLLLIAPNSTKGQWAEHWERWWSGIRVSVVDGSAAKRRDALEEDADVYVMHWQAVRLHSRLAPYGGIRLRKCGDHRGGDPEVKISNCDVHEKELNRLNLRSVVIDEAHRAKDCRSQQTRAVWAVQRQEKVQFRFALTGTPIADHPGDLWPVMHGIAPLEYPTRRNFEERYCLTTWAPFGGHNIVGINPSTREEFFGFFDPRFRRMPKNLVVDFLPPVVRERRDAPMAPKQQRAYREIEEEMMTRTEDGDLILTTNNLARNIRLVQFASAYAEVDEAGEVRLSEPSPKLDILEEILEDAAKPIVVCAESRQLIELAAARLERRKIPYGLLVGGMTADQRTAVLRELDDSQIRVLLFTMQAGGEGVNMTRADTIVRLQRSWSMLSNVQSLGRVHRIGSEQHRSITVIDTVAPDTIEEHQFRVYVNKLRRLEEIARDRNALREAGKVDELTALEIEEQSILRGNLL